MKNEITLEQRIKNIKELYSKLDILDEYVTEGQAKIIKDAILGDKELEKLINELDNYRSPRILMIGRTGFGKSSLINSLLGGYAAQISDSKECTTGTTKYNVSFNGVAPLEILDTRGISESLAIKSDKTAEEEIIEDVVKFDPDIALFVLNCSSRDGIDDDATFVKEIKEKIKEINNVNLPVIAVLNKADAVMPSRETVPFSKEKLENINDVKENITNIFNKVGLKVSKTIPVSSYLDWKDEDGNEYRTANQLNALTDEERKKLVISFDGRYQIEQLKKEIEKSVEDNAAIAGLKLVFHYEKTMKKICRRFVKTFSVIGMALVGAAIPVADFTILLALESLLVALIMALSGRELSFDAGKEFIGAVVGAAGAGLAFKQIARTALKFVPVAGQLITGVVASNGIILIGEAAIDYFIMDKDLESVQKKYKMNSKIRKIQNGAIKKIGQGKSMTKKLFSKVRNKIIKK